MTQEQVFEFIKEMNKKIEDLETKERSMYLTDYLVATLYNNQVKGLRLALELFQKYGLATEKD